MATKANLMQNQDTGQLEDRYGTVHSHHGTNTDNYEQALHLAQNQGVSMATAPIDLDGAWEVRVDCSCNAYSRETIQIPYTVIYDAVRAEVFGPAEQVAARRDERITATTVGGAVQKPTAQFRLTHLIESASSMRAAGMVPFNPFVKANLREVYQQDEAYFLWLSELEAEEAARE